MQMIDQLNACQAVVESYQIITLDDLERFKREITGKSGQLTLLLEEFKRVPKTEKAEIGKQINIVKQLIEEKLQSAYEYLAQQAYNDEPADLSLPGINPFAGGRHPVFAVEQKIIQAFQQIGFKIALTPEIETDWNNFTALNFEAHHPARDMQDTFFVQQNPDIVLRTHCTNAQIRVMEGQKPPFRIVAPGRVYRNETISIRKHCFFNQIDGFYVDTQVSFADLKQTLTYFTNLFFGSRYRVRFRPSYFPFTEISAEMDISYSITQQEGREVIDWVEILGCGMIDPNVLENCKIDPDKYSGFAFGMGVERIAQLLFKVGDIRQYAQNDLRFLGQFSAFH